MEFTLFQDFAHTIPRPAPQTGRPESAQSGRTPEFDYGPLNEWVSWTYLASFISVVMNNKSFPYFILLFCNLW